MVTPKIIINAHRHSVFDSKICNVILKTEQTTIIYAQWDRWASYDVTKHHMITSDVILKTALKTFMNPLC